MKNILNILPLFLLHWTSPTFGQINFRSGWEKANPIEEQSTLSLPEKVKIHLQFYEKAVTEKNNLFQLYGQIYLSSDYLKAQDYAEATRYLLNAEGIAQAANNRGWQGWVMYKKGGVSIKMKQFEEALKIYETAASLCGEAHDSLCLAESLEQVSIMYGMLDNFEKARSVNAIALPLLKKFGGDRQLATALGNFGIINSLQNRTAESIPYFEQAIEIDRKLANRQDEAKALNNLADAYRGLKQYNRALGIFQQCIKKNTENQYPENLMRNYLGIGMTYEAIGQYENAMNYFDKYYVLKDSLIGMETQQKIAELEIKYESQQKELALEKSKSELHIAKRSVERRTGLVFFVLTLSAFGLWRWRLQTLASKKDAISNQENLSTLTSILLEKNQQLTNLEQQLHSFTNQPLAGSDFDSDLYNQQILTDVDWSSFKAYFEKAHPNYIQRLRKTFPAITDAEERLFLLLKLNLTTKESATMLGISADSVKKTRNRLRKRLELAEEVTLEDFTRQF